MHKKEKILQRITLFSLMMLAAIIGIGLLEIKELVAHKNNLPAQIDANEFANFISKRITKEIFELVSILVIFSAALVIRKIEKNIIFDLQKKQSKNYIDEIENISDKLENEARLLKDYKNAIDNSAMVFKLDFNGRLSYVNEIYQKTTGFSKDEVIGKSLSEFDYVHYTKQSTDLIWEMVTKKEIWRGRMSGLKKNGDRYIVEMTIAPITNASGEIEEFIAVMFDITKEIALEQWLKQEAANRQKEEHQKELSKTKESFLVVFTHELKTPLNAIINFSSFVRKKLEKEEIKDKPRILELLESVKKNGEDMLFTVTNILDTAKLTSKKMEFLKSVFNLSELVSEVATRIIPPSGISFSADIQSEVYIKSDRLRISQIISNLLSNALKYGNGEIELTLKTYDKMFFLSIEDNGRGIKDPEAVFELFKAEEDTSIRSDKGTGIGLYYVKMLSDELELEIEVDKSQKLGGAYFCISGQLQENKHLEI